MHQPGGWGRVIKSFDPDSRAIAPLAPIPDDNQDSCWTPAGVILRAEGTPMLGFQPGSDDGWQPLVDLQAPGLNEGGRCAVGPDGRYLALVNQRAP